MAGKGRRKKNSVQMVLVCGSRLLFGAKFSCCSPDGQPASDDVQNKWCQDNEHKSTCVGYGYHFMTPTCTDGKQGDVCVSDGDCAPAFFCGDGYACTAARDQSQACIDDRQCKSGHCAGGTARGANMTCA